LKAAISFRLNEFAESPNEFLDCTKNVYVVPLIRLVATYEALNNEEARTVKLFYP
jgi:hypothetical protein